MFDYFGTKQLEPTLTCIRRRRRVITTFNFNKKKHQLETLLKILWVSVDLWQHNFNLFLKIGFFLRKWLETRSLVHLPSLINYWNSFAWQIECCFSSHSIEKCLPRNYFVNLCYFLCHFWVLRFYNYRDGLDSILMSTVPPGLSSDHFSLFDLPQRWWLLFVLSFCCAY